MAVRVLVESHDRQQAGDVDTEVAEDLVTWQIGDYNSFGGVTLRPCYETDLAEALNALAHASTGTGVW